MSDTQIALSQDFITCHRDLARLESHEVESSKEVEGAAVSNSNDNGRASADAVIAPAAIAIEVTPSAVVEHQLS